MDKERQHWMVLPPYLKAVSLTEYLTYGHLLTIKLDITSEAMSSIYPKALKYTGPDGSSVVRYALAYVRDPQTMHGDAELIKDMETFQRKIFDIPQEDATS